MSPDDLSEKVVCTQLASGAEKASQEWEKDMKSRGLGGFQGIKTFTAHPEATLAVANGTCDAQTQPLPNLAVVAKNQEGLELVGPISVKAYGVGNSPMRGYRFARLFKLKNTRNAG